MLGCTSNENTRCLNCANRIETFTVSEPTEIIYRNTTYKTIYEPRTYKEISYERRPYRECIKKEYCK